MVKRFLDGYFQHNGNEEETKTEKDWNPWGFELDAIQPKLKVKDINRSQDVWKIVTNEEDDVSLRAGDVVVEIWSKAAIGLYLWEHIFDSSLRDQDGNTWQLGEMRVGNLIFRFRTGPAVVEGNVPTNVENLVLVLNGRDENKVNHAKSWLKYIEYLHHLRNLGIVILGNEECRNSWIYPFLHRNGGPVKFVFLVYDSSDVDEDVFYQWPLGVATYRKFPHVHKSDIEVRAERDYTCNFSGTIYRNSSREQLLKILLSNNLDTKDCFVKPRWEWLSGETDETRENYVHALAQSDLTLHPVGFNSECYRLYEAVSFGSVPVVEDVMTQGICGSRNNLPLGKSTAPLRLLKQYDAPFIYLKNWTNVYDLIKAEQELSLEDVVNRRTHLLAWYDEFKNKMQEKFVSVLRKKFLL